MVASVAELARMMVRPGRAAAWACLLCHLPSLISRWRLRASYALCRTNKFHGSERTGHAAMQSAASLALGSCDAEQDPRKLKLRLVGMAAATDALSVALRLLTITIHESGEDRMLQ